MGKRKTWSIRQSLLLLPIVAMFVATIAASAFAEEQQVSLDPASVSVEPGSSFSLAMNYNVDTGDNLLTGIGIRVHYNSSVLQFDGASNVFSTGRILNFQNVADTANSDGDASTDRALLLSYADLTGDGWPNTDLPLKLADIAFTSLLGATADTLTTNINITFSSLGGVGVTGLGSGAAVDLICVNANTRDCGSDIGECAPGTETCVDGAWSGICEGGNLPTDELCDNLDNDCDNSIDEDLTQTINCGVGECASSVIQTCSAGEWLGTCTPGTPTDELCDNLDNNCDGSIDEDVSRATSCGVGECASTGIETCTAGSWGDNTCVVGTPSDETCDNLDNDCNGAIDDGLTRATSCGVGECSDNTGIETCTAGAWGDDTCDAFAGAVAETCDTLDNDCDGATDEDLTRATSCGIGGCAAAGIETCTDGAFSGDTCIPGDPSAEICDNIDNDCDEATDEDLTQATTCGLGICSGNTGEATCSAGAWVNDTCDPLAGAETETCDNIDNDCDGTIDDGLTRPTTCGVGECSDNTGVETCAAGAWGNDTCNPDAGAVAETCDNLDNDCDGSTDEDLTRATTCGVGECAAEGIENCSAGEWINDTCEAGTPADEICDDLDNNCDGVTDEDQVDSDGDGICDAIDICFGDGNDTDEDGVCDNLDACPGFDDRDDIDGDGAPDACEMGPDHDDAEYDGNGDGEADMNQANVASLFANAGQDYVTLSTNEDCAFKDVFNSEPDADVFYPEEGDSFGNEVNFPFGLFTFRVDCTAAALDPPGEVMVTFRMPDGTNKRGAITVNTYMKKDENGDWYDFRRVDGTGPGVDFLDDEVFMYFVDNELGDEAPAVNVILDPGAPAFVQGLPNPPTTGRTPSSSSSGCFIETLFSGFGKNK